MQLSDKVKVIKKNKKNTNFSGCKHRIKGYQACSNEKLVVCYYVPICYILNQE